MAQNKLEFTAEKLVRAALGKDAFKRKDKDGMIPYVEKEKEDMFKEPKNLGAAAARREAKEKDMLRKTQRQMKTAEAFMGEGEKTIKEKKTSKPKGERKKREDQDSGRAKKATKKQQEKTEDSSVNNPDAKDVSGPKSLKGFREKNPQEEGSDTIIPLGKSSLENNGISDEKIIHNNRVEMMRAVGAAKERLRSDYENGNLKDEIEYYYPDDSQIAWERIGKISEKDAQQLKDDLEKEKQLIEAEYQELKKEKPNQTEEFYENYGENGKNIIGKKRFLNTNGSDWMVVEGFSEKRGKVRINFNGEIRYEDSQQLDSFLEEYGLDEPIEKPAEPEEAGPNNKREKFNVTEIKDFLREKDIRFGKDILYDGEEWMVIKNVDIDKGIRINRSKKEGEENNDKDWVGEYITFEELKNWLNVFKKKEEPKEEDESNKEKLSEQEFLEKYDLKPNAFFVKAEDEQKDVEDIKDYFIFRSFDSQFQMVEVLDYGLRDTGGKRKKMREGAVYKMTIQEFEKRLESYVKKFGKSEAQEESPREEPKAETQEEEKGPEEPIEEEKFEEEKKGSEGDNFQESQTKNRTPESGEDQGETEKKEKERAEEMEKYSNMTIAFIKRMNELTDWNERNAKTRPEILKKFASEHLIAWIGKYSRIFSKDETEKIAQEIIDKIKI